jgi:ATP-binding cassette subfamily B protein
MNVLSFIRMALKPYHRYLALITVHSVSYATVLTMLTYCVRQLTNAAATNNIEALWQYFPYFVALIITPLISWRMYEWSILQYSPLLKNRITQCVFQNLTLQSHSYFQTNFPGALAAKVVDLIHGIPKMVIVVLHNSLSCLTTFCIALYMLSKVNYTFAIALVSWTAVFFTISISVVRRFNYLAKVAAEAGAVVYGRVVDAVTNMLGIRLFSSASREADIIAQAQDEYRIAAQNRRWFMIKLNTFQGMSFCLYQIVCVYLLINLYAQGMVTPGDFTLILGINLTLLDQLWKLSEEVRDFSEHWGMAEQALDTFYKPIEIIDRPDAQELIVSKGAIEFDNVQFCYDDSEALFQNNSIHIPAGQRVGLVGYSGSGKTTFVNLILRLFDVSAGRILIDGQNIASYTQSSLHNAIAVVPQDPALFHRSVRENIRYGNPKASDEMVEEAAHKADAHDFITHLPDGYDTNVGERGGKLSGGQRQRIAIARALIKKAPILIFDEATSQLDSKTEEAIQSALLDILRSQTGSDRQTTLVIAHRLSTLLHMDRILVFDHGHIVQDGPHDVLIKEEGLYASLWKAQVGGQLPE